MTTQVEKSQNYLKNELYKQKAPTPLRTDAVKVRRQ